MAGVDKLDSLPGAVVREVAQALYAGGEIIAAEAHVSITTGSVSGKNHVPSKPGEPPMNDLGELVGSIGVVQPKPLRVEVQATAGHAVPLEWGTSKIAARPFMRPARDKMKPAARELVRKAVNRALRKTFGK